MTKVQKSIVFAKYEGRDIVHLSMRNKPFFSCRDTGYTKIWKNEQDGRVVEENGGEYLIVETLRSFTVRQRNVSYDHAKHFISADFGSENLRICFAIIESYVLLDEKEFLQVCYDFKN